MKPYQKFARAFGYSIQRRERQPTADAHLSNLVRASGTDLVLDVGANRGQFARMLRDEGYQGEIHSFEPVAATYGELAATAAGDPAWTVHQAALGAAPGEAVINVTGASDMSSLLQPNEFGQEKFERFEVARTETVRVDTVDAFLAAQVPDADSRRILLKMDTQGYDLEVFAGARNSWPHIGCLLSELSLIPIYSGMPHYLAALQTYEEAGFAVTGIYPVSRNDDLTVIEMDCMLINHKQA
jgi:FkbM family methyltransferase